MERMHLKPIFTLIKENQKEGLELLYKQYFQFMYGVAFSVVKNEQDSYDIVQNVMLKLLDLKEERFPQKGEVSWLYRVVKNEALMLIRKERKNVDSDPIIEQGALDSNIEAFVDMDAYYTMIEGLKEKEKEIVTLKVLGGLSHKEIAQIMGKPKGTVQWLYNASIKKLRMTLNVSVILMTGIFIKRFIDQMGQLEYETDYILEGEIFEGNPINLTLWERILQAFNDPILLTVGIVLFILVVTSIFININGHKKNKFEKHQQNKENAASNKCNEQ